MAAFGGIDAGRGLGQLQVGDAPPPRRDTPGRRFPPPARSVPKWSAGPGRTALCSRRGWARSACRPCSEWPRGESPGARLPPAANCCKYKKPIAGCGWGRSPGGYGQRVAGNIVGQRRRDVFARRQVQCLPVQVGFQRFQRQGVVQDALIHVPRPGMPGKCSLSGMVTMSSSCRPVA